MRKLLVLAFLLTASAQTATFTSIQLNPAEPHPEAILESLYGAGSFIRISDDLDHILPGAIVSVTKLAGYAASQNTFVSFPVPSGTVGCINTTLSYTVNHCTDPTLNGSGVDYVATWQLKADPTVYFLGFEDWPFNSPAPNGQLTDYNFNDWVGRVQIESQQPEIPEPSTLLLVVGALLLVLGRRRT